MKKLLVLLSLLFIALIGKAQTWEWAKTVPGQGFDWDMQSDTAGNIYVVNWVNNTELGISKRDKNGTIVWADTIDGFSTLSVPNLVLDSQGNIYFAFRTLKSYVYRGDTTALNKAAIAILKLDNSGNKIWEDAIITQKANDLFCSPSCPPIYAFGDFTFKLSEDESNILFAFQAGSSSAGEITYRSELFEVANFFEAHYFSLKSNNADLNWHYALTNLGSSSYSNGLAITENKDGRVFCGAAISGSFYMNSTTIEGDDDADVLWFELDAQGKAVQHAIMRIYGDHNFVIGTQIVSRNDDLFIYGALTTSLVFPKGDIVLSSDYADGYVAKLNTNLETQWYKIFTPGNYAAQICDLNFDENDRIYVAGVSPNILAMDGDSIVTGSGWSNSGFMAKLNYAGDLMYAKPVAASGWDMKISVEGVNGIYMYSKYDVGDTSNYDTITVISTTEKEVLAKLDETGCGSDALTMAVSDSIFICDGDSVLLAPLGSFSSYKWNTGDTTSSIYVDTGSYYLTTRDGSGCSYSSGEINVYSNPNNMIPGICMVTVDPTSSFNLVVWEKEVSSDIDYYNIYRQAGVDYYIIGSVPYDSLSEFVDTTAGIDPNLTSYRYKLSTVDFCGNESALSSFHETMHLTVNKGAGSEINLIWDAYEGISFQYYYIMRDDFGTDTWTKLDSVSFLNFTYTDPTPPSINTRYRVEVKLPGACTSEKAKTYETTRSNRENSEISSGGAVVANFRVDNRFIYEGQGVIFEDLSGGSPDSRVWYFEGGTPATSTSSSPLVVYDSIGLFGVKLIVQDSASIDSIYEDSYILVMSADTLPEDTSGNVGIQEKVGDVVSISPNPSKGIYNLRFEKAIPGRGKLVVYNSLGVLVHSKEVEGFVSDMSLDISTLDRGMYILNILTENSNYNFRLLKE